MDAVDKVDKKKGPAPAGAGAVAQAELPVASAPAVVAEPAARFWLGFEGEENEQLYDSLRQTVSMTQSARRWTNAKPTSLDGWRALR